jgi:hypothetical protein
MRATAALAVLAAALTFTSVSLGASPTPRTVYIGIINSSPFQMHVSLTVAPTGKSATFTSLCGTGRPPTSIFNLSIDANGHFEHTAAGSGHAWKMAGHFTSPTSAFISLNSIDCGGSKGSTTMKPK